MQGMSERQYAAHVGLSRGAIQKAKAADRLVLFGSIDAPASDRRRAEMTDPSKQRKSGATKQLKPVPDTALSAVGDTLREQGLTTPSTGGGTTFLQAKTANEVTTSGAPRGAHALLFRGAWGASISSWRVLGQSQMSLNPTGCWVDGQYSTLAPNHRLKSRF